MHGRTKNSRELQLYIVILYYFTAVCALWDLSCRKTNHKVAEFFYRVFLCAVFSFFNKYLYWNDVPLFVSFTCMIVAILKWTRPLLVVHAVEKQILLVKDWILKAETVAAAKSAVWIKCLWEVLPMSCVSHVSWAHIIVSLRSSWEIDPNDLKSLRAKKKKNYKTLSKSFKALRTNRNWWKDCFFCQLDSVCIRERAQEYFLTHAFNKYEGIHLFQEVNL